MAGLTDKLVRAASGAASLGFDPTGKGTQRLVEIPVGDIDPDPKQPRKTLRGIEDLARSIAHQGLLSPIIVEPLAGTSRYRIIAGHRRHAAYPLARPGAPIPALVRTVVEQTRRELQIVENLQRESLLPLEEARALRELQSDFGLTQKQVAERLGRSEASLSELLRLLDLAPEIQEDLGRVTEGAPTKSTLLEIAKAPSLERQKELYEKARRGEYTTATSKAQKAEKAAKKRRKKRHAPAPNVRAIETDVATVVITLADGAATTPVACISALQGAIKVLKEAQA
jgi:ParB family chromosome partitioning protein